MSNPYELLDRVVMVAKEDEEYLPGDKTAYVIGPSLYEDIKDVVKRDRAAQEKLDEVKARLDKNLEEVEDDGSGD